MQVTLGQWRGTLAASERFGARRVNCPAQKLPGWLEAHEFKINLKGEHRFSASTVRPRLACGRLNAA
jgi:hypothetical protein